MKNKPEAIVVLLLKRKSFIAAVFFLIFVINMTLKIITPKMKKARAEQIKAAQPK